jgi:hypothetical protein
MKQRYIFIDDKPAGFKDPICWLIAVLIWVLVWNAPAVWHWIGDFVRYVIFLGKLS